MGMIIQGVQKTMAFLENTIELYNLIDEEWNTIFANTESNLA